jgi:1-acyl-sn-glycerol-3-phosphate acyltransferase
LKSIIYWFTWCAARGAFWLLWRYRVVGAEHLPRSGPFILAGNHRSTAEPAILGCTPRRRNFFFAKRELFDRPLFGRYIRALGAFPVARGQGDLAAVRYSLDVLARGHVLVFFPEGTRSKTGGFLPAQPGIGLIALRARVPVVPAYVAGSVEALRSLIPRRPVRAYIGEPIDTARLELRGDRRGYQQFADLVLDRIKELAQKFDPQG